MARTINCRVFFDWDFNGVFTDETANLVRASGELRFNPPEQSITASSGIVDACTLEMYNNAGRYSPLNTSGALYTYIQTGKAFHCPVYVETCINGVTYTTIFTGVAKIPRETGRSVEGIPTVEFECRSVDELYLQRRMSTTQAGLVSRYDDGATEAYIINAFLVAAGAASTTCDNGIIPIPWSWLDDESPIEDVWQLAAAVGGRFYASPAGVLTYESMDHWLKAPHQTSQQTYTADDWQTFTAQYDDSELFDSISVEFSGRTPEGVSVLWEPDEAVQVPAGGSVTLIANYSYPAFSITGIVYKAATAGGSDITSDFTITPTYYAQRAKLVVANANTTYAGTIWPLQINGRGLVGGPSAEVERNSTDHGTNAAFFTTRGSRNRRVSNIYIQTRAQAAMLAQFLLDRHEKPRLTYNLRGVPAVPERKPGDRITLNDTSVMSSARAAIVTGLSWRYEGMSYVQDIEAIDAADLYPAGTYFVLGTNTLGGASATPGVTFY